MQSTEPASAAALALGAARAISVPTARHAVIELPKEQEGSSKGEELNAAS